MVKQEGSGQVNINEGNYVENLSGNYIQRQFVLIVDSLPCLQQNILESKRTEFIEAVRKRVNRILIKSLQGHDPIILQKQTRPRLVNPLSESEVRIGREPSSILPENTNIVEIFDKEEIDGKLLILGKAGSGKTVSMLQLAKVLIERADIIERADKKQNFPIPVWLNLASWKNDPQDFQNWIISQIKSIYGVRRGIVKQFLKGRQILLMLDALDEIPHNHQENCIQAINNFLESEIRPSHLVVSSRIENYSLLAGRLRLNQAIYLQELSDIQIQNILRNFDKINFWESIQSDRNLLDLFRNPLILGVATLKYFDISSEAWHEIASGKNPMQSLLDIYIRQMCTRTLEESLSKKKQLPNKRETLIKLSWLARQMKREGKTDFLIEKMQPNLLLQTDRQKFLYRLILIVACGTISLIVGKAIVGLLAIFTTLFYLIFRQEESDNEYEIASFYDIVDSNEEQVEESRGLFNNEYLPINLILVLIISFIAIIVFDSSCITLFPNRDKYALFFCQLVELLVDGYGFIVGAIIGININLKPIILSENFKFPNILKKAELKNYIKNFVNGFLYGFTTGLIIFPNFKSLCWRIFVRTSIFLSFLTLMIILLIDSSQWTLALIPIKLIVTLVIICFLSSISLGTIRGLCLGIIQGFRVDIESKSYPNEGIIKSAQYSLLLTFIAFVIAFILAIFSKDFAMSKDFAISILAVYLMPVTDFGIGGLACIQHIALRITLSFEGFVSWKYTNFLNSCVDRLLLQRVGGRYQFFHTSLRDHFADMSNTEINQL